MLHIIVASLETERDKIAVSEHHPLFDPKRAYKTREIY